MPIYLPLPRKLYPDLAAITTPLVHNITYLQTLADEVLSLTHGTNAEYTGELVHAAMSERSALPWVVRQGEEIAYLMQDALDAGLDGDGHYRFEAGEFSLNNRIGGAAINLKYNSDPRISRGRGRSTLSKIIARDWDERVKKLQLAEAEREQLDTWRTKFLTVLAEVNRLANELYHSEASEALWGPERAANLRARGVAA